MQKSSGETENWSYSVTLQSMQRVIGSCQNALVVKDSTVERWNSSHLKEVKLHEETLLERVLNSILWSELRIKEDIGERMNSVLALQLFRKNVKFGKRCELCMYMIPFWRSDHVTLEIEVMWGIEKDQIENRRNYVRANFVEVKRSFSTVSSRSMEDLDDVQKK